MRLVLLAVLASVLGGFACASASASDRPAKIRLTNGEWPPYQSRYLPEYGAASQLVTAAFDAVGIEVEYGFFPWNRAMLLVEQGAWDGTFMWVLTPERERLYLPSDPLFTLREVLFYSREDPIAAVRPEDLKGKIMGVLDSSAFGEQFNPLIEQDEIYIARVPNNRQLFQMLAMGRVDFVPELETSGYEAVNQYLTADQTQQITHLKTLTHTWSYHMLISRRTDDGPYFVDAFNRGMEILRENGEFERIIGPYTRPKVAN